MTDAGEFMTDTVESALASMPEPEKCPECDAGVACRVEERPGQLVPVFSICPACYGFGRVLSGGERAICRLMAERPEWARAVLAAAPYSARPGAAARIREVGCRPEAEVVRYADGGWCALLGIECTAGDRSDSLAEAVCQALGMEGAREEIGGR